MTGLYVIAPCDARDVAEAAAGRASYLQLRDKSATGRELYSAATEMRRLTRDTDTRFVVNDRADVALAADADAVHLGKTDLPLSAAKELGLEVGRSNDTVAEAREAAAVADYVSIGPVYPTDSKPDVNPPIGLETVREVKESVDVPVVAIGGIDHSNAAAVADAGADHVAVLSAVQGDPAGEMDRILDAIEG